MHDWAVFVDGQHSSPLEEEEVEEGNQSPELSLQSWHRGYEYFGLVFTNELENFIDCTYAQLLGDEWRERGVDFKVRRQPAQHGLVLVLTVDDAQRVGRIVELVVETSVDIENPLLFALVNGIGQCIVGYKVLEHFVVFEQKVSQLGHTDLLDTQRAVTVVAVQAHVWQHVLSAQFLLDTFAAFVKLGRLLLVAKTGQKYQIGPTLAVQLRYVGVHDSAKKKQESRIKI